MSSSYSHENRLILVSVQAGLGAASTRRMLRATKDASVTVGLLVATETDDEKTAVLATLRNTIKSGIFPARLNSAGAWGAASAQTVAAV